MGTASLHVEHALHYYSETVFWNNRTLSFDGGSLCVCGVKSWRLIIETKASGRRSNTNTHAHTHPYHLHLWANSTTTTLTMIIRCRSSRITTIGSRWRLRVVQWCRRILAQVNHSQHLSLFWIAFLLKLFLCFTIRTGDRQRMIIVNVVVVLFAHRCKW